MNEEDAMLTFLNLSIELRALRAVADAARALDALVDPVTLNWGHLAYENLHLALQKLDEARRG